jgi:hypothetical protein
MAAHSGWDIGGDWDWALPCIGSGKFAYEQQPAGMGCVLGKCGTCAA